MEIVIPRCAGLDVHKETVVACVRILEGTAVHEEVRTFKTFTRNLLALSDWLREQKVTHVAMESTGVYWKPIFNVLESQFEVLLVNAHHIKQVPGRKTDVKDCQWIAKLLQHGLLKASFIPDRPIRDMRDLTRERAKLTQEATRVANRIQKYLEDANIKLGSVASDVLGVSGREMLKALAAGETSAAKLADLARGRLREKLPELRVALAGSMTEHHRFMIRFELRRLASIEGDIAVLDERIEEVARPFEAALRLMETITGVKRRSALDLLAEIGPTATPFPSASHFASWAGICPGNNESAGKRKSGRTNRGNRWLRRVITQVAWAASRTKKSYYSAFYSRLAARRGKKRAIVALAHSILVSIYHMLQTGETFIELGKDYLDGINRERAKRYHSRRLRELGFNVSVAEDVAAA